MTRSLPDRHHPGRRMANGGKRWRAGQGLLPRINGSVLHFCISIMSAAGIMLPFRLAMITREPAITSRTMSTPNASASTLFVLSGPVVMCRKNTRWTPIWAIARTARPSGIPAAQSSDVLATQNDSVVRIRCHKQPNAIDDRAGENWFVLVAHYRPVAGSAIGNFVVDSHGATPIR